MEGNNRPLALDSWTNMNGPNSYTAAINAVNDVLDPEKDEFLAAHPELLEFMKRALYHRITTQSQENYNQYLIVQSRLTDAHADFISGNQSPSALTLFLYATEGLPSIETARRTSRHWNIYQEIDRPVRDDLDQNPYLYTNSIKSEPLYRIKNLNVTDRSNQYFVQIDRKRTVREHFGGKVLTIVRNSLVLDNENRSMPVEVRQYIDTQREQALDQTRRESNSDYNYDQHSELLRDYLEDHVTHRSDNVQPSWVTPIATGYYAAKQEFVKTKQLIPRDHI